VRNTKALPDVANSDVAITIYKKFVVAKTVVANAIFAGSNFQPPICKPRFLQTDTDCLQNELT